MSLQKLQLIEKEPFIEQDKENMEYSEDKASNREAFEIQQSQDEDDDYITVDKPHVVLTIWNLLITASCIGLFAYVNSYFTIRLQQVVNGSVIREQTATFSCDQYFCDRTLFNYMYYYSFYQQCNQQICTNLVCTTYQCGSNQYYVDMNRYFACEPKCPDYFKSDYPKLLFVAYALSLSAAVCFALNLIVHIFMSIILNIKARQIKPKERIGLLLSFLWPSLKYYFLRERKSWSSFDVNLKAVVTADYICAVLLSITMAIYIWFYIVGTWFENKEIALFFILLGSYITHWMVCWSNGRAFWKAKERF